MSAKATKRTLKSSMCCYSKESGPNNKSQYPTEQQLHILYEQVISKLSRQRCW